MNHRHRYTKQDCTCNIITPDILESIARNGTPTQRALAQQTLELDRQIRLRRDESRTRLAPSALPGVGPARKNRRVYTAANSTNLPGTLVRSEGDGPSGEVAVDEAYDGLGATFDLYWDIYGRNSINDNGMDLIATVHYRNGYNNAFWNGTQMVFGDGDGTIFNRFTIAIDVMGHELTHGVTQFTAALEYNNQSGALNESISDVFGSLVKQRALGQTAAQADWLIGAGLWAPGINGVALRSMSAPGTAYNDPVVGKDPQPDHMSRYVNTTSDNGGVHTNSGIPNKAFYLAAIAIGGNSWDKTGNIWYRTLLDSRLSETTQFQDFANLTTDNANRLYGTSARDAVVRAWRDVGIVVATVWNGPADLTTVPNIVALAGHFSTADQRHLLVAGTANGKVHEIFWKPAQVGIEGQDDLPVTFGAGSIVSVATMYNSDQHRHVVLVGTKDGKVHEIWWKPETVGIEGHDDLPVAFSPNSIRAVAGLYNPDHQRYVVFVGTTAGNVHEIWWKEGTAGVEGHDDLPVTFAPGSIVGVTGFYNTDQQRYVVVVATSAGKLHEIFWKEGTAGVEGHDDLPVSFGSGSIVAVSGFYDASRQRHVVVVGTKDGKVNQVYWQATTVGIEANSTVTQFSADSIVGLAGWYSASDQVEVIEVGLTNGLIREFWAKADL